VLAAERQAERNPLNLIPVNTGVGKPELPRALFVFVVGETQ